MSKLKPNRINLLLRLVLIVLLLLILINDELSANVKILGSFILFSGLLASWYYQRRLSKKLKRIERFRLNVNDRFWLNEEIHFYKHLDKGQKKVFEDRVGLFLAEIIVTEIGKEVCDKSSALYVASAAVITYWGLPYWNYGNLREVLLYPENFDEDYDIDQKHTIQGKVYHGGLMNNTMSLSLKALKHGFENDSDKKNVGVHEFAHLLDKADGSVDGLPFMMSKEVREKWISVIHKEMENIEDGSSDINPYAHTNNAEFFAVITEYFKERPELLKKKHPEIYSLLAKSFNS